MNAEASPSPSLFVPVDARSVDGSEVTFVWAAVEGADSYRLQVAPTAQFEKLIVDADVGAETAVTVGNQLPTDGQTLFWRVRAKAEGQESTTSSVESFIATTEAEAEQDGPPAEDEEPVTDLARAARREATVETFDFEDQFEKEKERGVAYEGVAASQIMGISASIIAVVLVAVAILFGWFEQVSQSAQRAAGERQQYRQIRQVEMRMTKKLQQYGVVDREAGTYHMPIDRAMELIAREDGQEGQKSQ